MPIPYSFYSEIQKENAVWKLKADIRDMISTLCKDIEIIDGAVCEDHIHLSVVILQNYNISKFMGD